MMPLLALVSQVVPLVPKEERSFVALEHGWHLDLLAFLQHGVPKIIGALIIAFIALQIVRFFVKRLRKRADSMVGNTRRAAQLRTVAGIIRASAYGLLGFYVFIQILGALNVPLGSFIAAAGVIGLGISFGAQSLFKDMLTGVFILLEDQYSIGDTVKIAGLQGTVEDLTLRMTKLRDGDGTLYIVPNSQITTVSNLSRDFAVATLPVSVSTAEDPDRVMRVLNQLASDLRTDEAFKDVVIAEPTVLGVDKITGHEVIYPINLRVQVNQRDGVLRELRRRILLAFEKENIAFGTSSSTLVLERPDPTAPPAH
ncbi:MAG TPA: mechanosensitive ion channel domain-containing protein [Acidobacteriaceae bacterium]|jgi:small conductance mechanosensitive channel|nr:mechanosensitive ion channel domain-containing protein [Acidobacteriaceae bacterium]